MRRQGIIAGVAIVVVIALFYMFLLRPVSADIGEVKTQITAAKSEESTLQLQIVQLERARQNATEIAARLAKFDLLLPKSSDIPAFIRQVQEAADLSGTALASIAPSPPSPVAAGPGVSPAVTGQGVFAVNVVLQVSGGFFRLESFLQRLENLQRVVIVNNMSIAPTLDTETGLFTLQSTITMQMFLVNPNASPTGQIVPSPSPSPTASPGATATPTSPGGASGPATPAPTSS